MVYTSNGEVFSGQTISHHLAQSCPQHCGGNCRSTTTDPALDGTSSYCCRVDGKPAIVFPQVKVPGRQIESNQLYDRRSGGTEEVDGRWTE